VINIFQCLLTTPELRKRLQAEQITGITRGPNVFCQDLWQRNV